MQTVDINDKKVEALSVAECEDFARIMTIKHGSNIQQKRFSVRSYNGDDGVYIEVTLLNDEQSFFYKVEGRYHKSGELGSRDAVQLMLDYIDLYFEDYLKDDSVLLHLDWNDHNFEDETFQLRGQITNLKLEHMADELLKQGLSSADKA